MAGITLQQAQEILQATVDSYKATLKLQAWTHKDRQAQKARLAELLESLKYWQAEVARLSSPSSRTGGMTLIRVRPV